MYSESAWKKLLRKGDLEVDEGEYAELRNCERCGSTIAVEYSSEENESMKRNPTVQFDDHPDALKYEKIVSRPGKFENSARYVPYFWEAALDGEADDDDGAIYKFVVDEDDSDVFPELEVGKEIYLAEREDGFVVEADESEFGNEEEEEEEEGEDYGRHRGYGDGAQIGIKKVEGEYQVRLVEGGRVRNPDATYFTPDPEDALNTAADMAQRTGALWDPDSPAAARIRSQIPGWKKRQGYGESSPGCPGYFSARKYLGANPTTPNYGPASDAIKKSMARTLFVTAWADKQEEAGKTYPGMDLFDAAPKKTPAAALISADSLIKKYERVNNQSVVGLLLEAERADGAREIDPDSFGHYLAMMALGHGVSWFDDHERFPLKVPPHEFYL